MDIKRPFVFQTDSDIVQKIYTENPNYLIEYSDNVSSRDYCAVYFCSHNIYYPNTEDVFTKRIVENNLYEWYNTRIQKSYKHIFVRDIFKQWYIAGINAEINSPEKLLEFLRQETKGYKVITLGSSAGGYAAVLYGSLLNANQVLAFNPQFELKSLLKRSNEDIDPLLFRLKNKPVSIYYDIYDFINEKIDIYYFYSNKSDWDMEQYNHIKSLVKIHKISFSTTHHGIPFLKVNLPIILNLDKTKLTHLAKTSHNTWLFSFRIVGIRKTLFGLISQIYKKYYFIIIKKSTKNIQ
jgi:hypothetical protein